MSFDISCDLSDLIHHSNLCHKGHHCINAQSCYRGPVCSQKVVKIAEVMREDCGGYAQGAMAIRAPSELKMTVRGTMVRSEVCNSWCFCLES